MRRLFDLTPLFALAAFGLFAFGARPLLGPRAAPVRPAQDADESPIDVAKLPPAVQATVKRIFGTLENVKASQETEDGIQMFEIEGKGADGKNASFTCVASGQIQELERETTLTSLPSDTAKNLQRAFPGSTIVSAEEVQEHYFEVKITQDGKTRGAKVSVAGRVLNPPARKEKKEEDEEDEGR